MNFANGKRDEWEFDYTASKLAEGAKIQKEFRLSRVTWWSDAKEKLMAEVKESGLEVNESVADKAGYLSNVIGTRSMAPTISIKPELQQKLQECHQKINSHQQAAAEYDGWVQVLEANPESRLKLTQGDWLYFFGKA